jgi:hypothetical protein
MSSVAVFVRALPLVVRRSGHRSSSGASSDFSLNSSELSRPIFFTAPQQVRSILAVV